MRSAPGLLLILASCFAFGLWSGYTLLSNQASHNETEFEANTKQVRVRLPASGADPNPAVGLQSPLLPEQIGNPLQNNTREQTAPVIVIPREQAQGESSVSDQAHEAGADAAAIAQANKLNDLSLSTEAAGKDEEIKPVVSTEAESSRPLLAPGVPLKINPVSHLLSAFWGWLGLGADFSDYTQDVPGLSDLEFQSLKAVAVTIGAGARVTEKWGFEVAFKQAPGEVFPADGVPVTTGEFYWKSMSGEVLYFSKDGDGTVGSVSYNLRFGAQYKTTPFLNGGTGSVVIRDINSTVASIGFEAEKKMRSRLRGKIIGRILYPVSSRGPSGTSVQFTPVYAIDGQTGVVYDFKSGLWVGAFVSGEVIKYNFKYREGVIDLQGTQSHFNSTFDVRLGFELK